MLRSAIVVLAVTLLCVEGHRGRRRVGLTCADGSTPTHPPPCADGTWPTCPGACADGSDALLDGDKNTPMCADSSSWRDMDMTRCACEDGTELNWGHHGR